MILSVCLITYNHEKYIRQAIEGVLMQKVNFQWQLIIADDYSTDGTRPILLEYKNKYPDFITLILQEKNVGAAQNWLDLITFPKSKYIAYFEGDDYWIHSHKLQKQVDFLNKHSECSFCFHTAYRQLGNTPIDNTTEIYPKGITKTVLNPSDYLGLTTTATCSLVFRNIELKAIHELIHSQGDFILYCALLEHGNAGFIDETMSVYRKHAQGVSFSHSTRGYMQNRIRELKIELNYFTNKAVKHAINRKYVEFILVYFHLHANAIEKEEYISLKKELRYNAFYYGYKIEQFLKRVKRKLR